MWLAMAGSLALAAAIQREASPRELRAENLCAAVESQAIELQPRHPDVVYQFQTLLYDAARVRPGDASPVAATKVGALFARRMPDFLCTPVNFVPQGGNILKLAVSRQADAFIDDALLVWRIDLNQVDRADGGTLLDYVRIKVRNAGSNASLAGVYQRYYDRFRKAGAKHAAELTAPRFSSSPEKK